MNSLRLFISSTCYDLSQIRADLRDFLIGNGYIPILSESSAFPIDPDNSTLENCISNVTKSDVFILIVGSRYGYISNTGKSITNTEYIHAKQRGIPIYIFIYKPLINILPVWKNNPEANFSGTVDSTKVFEFIEELREKNKSWCFEFEKAQDIIYTLKIQLSNLFKESLDLRKKYRITDQPSFYNNLSSVALNIILKKQDYFETIFFLQVLRDELDKYENLKLDLEYQILINCTYLIDNTNDLFKWLKINFETVTNFVNSLNNLFDKAFKFFYGEPGEASDLKGLYYVANGIAKIYKELVLWSINVKSTRVDKEFILIRNTLSEFPLVSLEEIWDYPTRSLQQLKENMLKLSEDPLVKINVKSILNLTIDEVLSTTFEKELKRLTYLYG